MSVACPLPSDKEYAELERDFGKTVARQVWESMKFDVSDIDLAKKVAAKFASQAEVVKRLGNKDMYSSVLDMLKNTDVEYIDKNYRIKSSQELIVNRVSDRVAQMKAELQGDRDAKYNDPIYALKGTVLHKHLEISLKHLIAGKRPAFNAVMKQVKDELMTHPDFEGRTADFFEMTPAQFVQISTAISELVQSVKEVQKSIDPTKKAEIFSETIIFDEYQQLAGTMDMIVVYSDGSASVFDFKSYSGKPGVAPYQGKVEAWQVQMSNYRKILKDIYGIHTFRHSRVIPLQVRYSKLGDQTRAIVEEGFQSVSMQVKESADKTAHLNPVPLEEMTGDKGLDKLLTNMISQVKFIKAQQRKAGPDRKFEMQRRINRLEKAIVDIQLRRDISGVSENVNNLIEYVNNRLFLDPTNHNRLTDGELSDLYKEFNLYKEVASDYNEQLKSSELSEEDKGKVKSNLSSLQTEVNLVQGKLIDRILESLPDDITDAGNVPIGMAKMFYGMSDYNMPVFRELNKILRKHRNQVMLKTQADIEDIRKYDDAFSKWASENGYDQNEKFDLIYNSERGELVTKYNKDFWSRYREIREKLRDKKGKLAKQDINWINENFSFNKELYEADRKGVFKSIQDEIEAKQIGEEEADRRREMWLASRIPKKDDDGNFLLSSITQLSYMEPVSSDPKHINEKWEFIQKHKPLKDYYEMYLRYNELFGKQVGRNVIGRNFVAHVQQGALDKLLELGPSGVPEIGEAFMRSYMVRQEDEMSGAVDRQGNFLNTIPLLYSDPMRFPLNDKEDAMVAAEVEALFKPGTKEYTNEYNRRKAKAEYKKGISTKSRDLTKSLMLMTGSVNEYLSLQSIEGTVKAMQLLVHENMVSSKVITKESRVGLERFTKTVLEKTGMDPDLVKAFDTFVNQHVYKQRFESDFILADKYSANKILTDLMSYFSLRSLGLNFVLIAANFVQARTGFWIKAREDRHFGKHELKEAMSSFTPDRDGTSAKLIDYFMVASRDLVREEIEKSGATFLSRKLTQRTAYIGHILGDENVDNITLIAMSKRYVLDSDGKIKNPKIHTIIDSSAKSVYDLMSESGDKRIIPGLSIEEWGNFRAKVQKMTFNIKGSTTEEHKGLASANMVMTMLMQFRNWIPGLYENRFGKIMYDETMESFEQGYLSVGWGEIIGNNMLPSIKETSSLIAELVSFGAFKKSINMKAAKRSMDKFITNNPEYKGKLTLTDYVALRRSKLNAALAELRVYLSFMVLVQILGGLEWDDEESSIFSKSAYDIARRGLLEVSFWWSPDSVNQIVKSPLPLWGMTRELQSLLENAVVETSYVVKGERDPRDKTPAFYYTLKNTPILNQSLRIFGFFNEYQPKKSLWDKIMDDDEE